MQSSESSDDECGEKKSLVEKMKEKLFGEKDDEKEEVKCLETSLPPVEKCDDVPTHHEHEKKGLMDKIKEKLPGGKKHEDDVVLPHPECTVVPEAHEEKEKKGFLEMIKEKIPGLHHKSHEEKEEEKGHECY